jgi:hypothetical protein
MAYMSYVDPMSAYADAYNNALRGTNHSNAAFLSAEQAGARAQLAAQRNNAFYSNSSSTGIQTYRNSSGDIIARGNASSGFSGWQSARQRDLGGTNQLRASRSLTPFQARLNQEIWEDTYGAIQPRTHVTPYLPVQQPVDSITGQPVGAIQNQGTLSAGNDSAVLYGGRGLYAFGAGNDAISTRAGSGFFAPGTVVNGNAGRDGITGFSLDGNVTYRGGAGDDEVGARAGLVYGDKGRDAFRPFVSNTADFATVVDYTPGEDVFLGSSIAGGEFKQLAEGLMFYTGTGEPTMLLAGIDASQVTYV